MIYGKYSRDAHHATSSNRGQSQWMRERASGPIEPMNNPYSGGPVWIWIPPKIKDFFA